MDPQNPVIDIGGSIVPGKGIGRAAYALQCWLAHSDYVNIPHLALRSMKDTYPEIEAEIDAKLEKANAPAIIVGHSYGGAYAARYGMSRPDKVKRVVTWHSPTNGVDITDSDVGRWLRNWLAATMAFVLRRDASKMVSFVWQLSLERVEQLLAEFAPGLHDIAFVGDDIRQLRLDVATSWPELVDLRQTTGIGERVARPRRSCISLERSIKYFLGHLFRPPGLPPEVVFVRAGATGHMTTMFGHKVSDIALEKSRRLAA